MGSLFRLLKNVLLLHSGLIREERQRTFSHPHILSLSLFSSTLSHLNSLTFSLLHSHLRSLKFFPKSLFLHTSTFTVLSTFFLFMIYSFCLSLSNSRTISTHPLLLTFFCFFLQTRSCLSHVLVSLMNFYTSLSRTVTFRHTYSFLNFSDSHSRSLFLPLSLNLFLFYPIHTISIFHSHSLLLLHNLLHSLVLFKYKRIPLVYETQMNLKRTWLPLHDLLLVEVIDCVGTVRHTPLLNVPISVPIMFYNERPISSFRLSKGERLFGFIWVKTVRKKDLLSNTFNVYGSTSVISLGLFNPDSFILLLFEYKCTNTRTLNRFIFQFL